MQVGFNSAKWRGEGTGFRDILALEDFAFHSGFDFDSTDISPTDEAESRCVMHLLHRYHFRIGLGQNRPLDIIDVRYRPLKILIAVALSILLSSAWSGSGQISTTAPSTAEPGRIQNIAPEEMWKRVTQCVLPNYPGLALDSGIA